MITNDLLSNQKFQFHRQVQDPLKANTLYLYMNKISIFC